VVYHQCWSRIAFLQVLWKTVVSRARGREAVKSHYQCTSIALRVEFVTTAGDHPTDFRWQVHIEGTIGYTGG
jgi:hypothetical protein